MRAAISSLKSSEPAVKPLTPTTWPPLTLGRTCGTTSSRSASTAASDVSSVPVPASGTPISATSPSGLVSTVTGSWNRSESRATSRISSAAAWTRERSRFSPSSTMSAVNCSPGKAACIRS